MQAQPSRARTHSFRTQRPFRPSWRGRTTIHGLLIVSTLVAPACSDDTGGGIETDPVSRETAGAANVTQPEDDAASRYFDPNHVVQVDIQMDTASWDALRTEERTLNDVILGSDCQSSPFASPFTWKRASVSIDGTTLSDVGLRKKGFLGSLDERRPSLKIGIDEFVTQDLFGVRDLTLNNVLQDPAVISQCLGYAVFARAGLPAPRCNFAHVVVNGQDLGVYTHVEPIKKPFLRRHFASDDGHLYEGTLSDFREGWLGTFDPKTSETDASKAVLQPIVAAAAAPTQEVVTRLRSLLDLDGFATFWATETLIAHVDGYSRNTNNFYAYRPADTGLVTLLPWGADLLFGNGDPSTTTNDPIGKYTEGIIVHALYTSSEGRSLLLGRLKSVLETAWDETELIAEAQRMAELIRPLLGPTQSKSFEQGLKGLQDFLLTRRAALTQAIASPPNDAQPLRPPACLRPIGTVSGTFTTSWRTSEVQDPFAAGTASLELVLNGSRWVSVPGKVGAFAGLNPDPTASQEAQLVIPALRSDGMLGVLAFGFDLKDAVPGTLTLDLGRVPGILLELQPSVSGSETVLGVVLGGTLVFDAVGTAADNPVTGRFDGEVYDTPFLNGF